MNSPKVMPGCQRSIPTLPCLLEAWLPSTCMTASHLQHKNGGLQKGPLLAKLQGALQAAHFTHGPHLGCMNTANVLRAMPAALPWAGVRTKWGVALNTPPVRTCSQCRESERNLVLGDRVQERRCTSPHAAPVHCAMQLHDALSADGKPQSPEASLMNAARPGRCTTAILSAMQRTGHLKGLPHLEGQVVWRDADPQWLPVACPDVQACLRIRAGDLVAPLKVHGCSQPCQRAMISVLPTPAVCRRIVS